MSPFSPGVPQSPLSPCRTTQELDSLDSSLEKMLKLTVGVRDPPCCPCNLADPGEDEMLRLM